MKITFLIILSLVQFSVHGQLSQWNQETVMKNKIETVSVFQKVPKANPEYYDKPRGFMSIYQTKFDPSGLLIEEVCKDCVFCSHCDQHSVDVSEKYYYKNRKLIRKEISRFEKSTLLFYYDTLKNRMLEIGLDENNLRNTVKIKYLNTDGKEISGFGIDFDDALIKPDSVIQIFLTKSITEYKRKSQTLKEFSFYVGTKIDRQRFEIFKNSSDIETISKTFETLNYSHLELRKHITTYYDAAGDELKEVDETNGMTIREYQRDKKGLIKTEIIYWPKFTAKYVYRYKFRD